MDKYEFKLKVDEMKALVSARNYKAAAEIAETINWRKIRNLNALVLAGEIFEQVERYEESKEILLLAYDKSPIGRNIIYRLAEIAIKTKNFHEAKEYYDEFVDIAPHDNLKYVLKYKMTAAQGLPYENQIKILEELKEQEYSEEWAYELAYLYHRNRQPDKCVEACDELILWFGDGAYVEKALELKMHYQPLTKMQEEKYRMFRQRRAGVIEVKPDDFLESGEIINETVQIPSVVTNPGRFNTANLQNEIAKGMQQIINAKKKETVSDAMDNIKKLVEDIPYLSMPTQGGNEQRQATESVDDEIDRQLDKRLNMMLHEPKRGHFVEPEADAGAPEPEKPMSTMTIEEVLAEWEKTKQAAKSALQEADDRKLESEKEKALGEASALMDRLLHIVPKLTAGVTPKELLEQEYLQGTDVLNSRQPDSVEHDIDKAGQIVAGINELLQKQIDTLLAEEGIQEAGGAKEEEPAQQREHRVMDPTRELPRLSQTRNPQDAALQETEQQRLEQARFEQDRLEQERLEQARFEQERLEQERYEQQRFEREKLEQEKLEQQRIEQEKIEYERLERERLEAERLERERLLEERRLKERLKRERLDRERSKQESRQSEGLLEERLDSEGLLEENRDGETLLEESEEQKLGENRLLEEQLERLEQERLLKEQLELEQERLLKEQLELEQERLAEETQEEEISEEDLQAAAKEAGFSEKPPMPNAPVSYEAAEMEHQPVTYEEAAQQMSEEQKQFFSWYISVNGMESQIFQVLKNVSAHLQMDKNSLSGNIIVEGVSRCGKTELVKKILQILQSELDRPNKKIGKIHANTLNQKDVAALVQKVSGGCLIIESAGRITRETAVTMARCMDMDRTGTLYVLEDTKENIVKALDRDSSFAMKFTEKVSIPQFTIDDYAAFGRSYANELNYDIDEMGNLALYKRISNIQRLDHFTSLDEVMEIIDEAISNAEKVTLKKMFGILTATRYNDDRYVVLHEKDFMES